MSRSRKKKITKIGDLTKRARVHRLDNGFFLHKEGSPLGEYFPSFTNYIFSKGFNISLHPYRRNVDGSFDLTDHTTGITYKMVPNISRTKRVFNSLNGFAGLGGKAGAPTSYIGNWPPPVEAPLPHVVDIKTGLSIAPVELPLAA